MNKNANAYTFYRYTAVLRVTHALTAVCLYILALSGWQIFTAHPSLYWGVASDFAHPLLSMNAIADDDDELHGMTTVLGHSFETTGVFGASADVSGEMEVRGFPSWLTIPSYRALALGRLWHFFCAWLLVLTGAVYLTHSVITKHLQRELVPTKDDWRSLKQSLLDHMRLRHPKGEAARRYNILQRLAYLVVIGGLVPAMILTGLAMSPRLAVTMGWLTDLLGGHQAMRTVHFCVTAAIVGFFCVHLFEVLVNGAYNNVRAIITGRFRIVTDKAETP